MTSKSEIEAAESAAIMANVFHLVQSLGAQLAEQGFSAAVLWYLLSCAARTVEHGLIAAVQVDPELGPVLEVARQRLPRLIAEVDRDTKTIIPPHPDAAVAAEWKLWALSVLCRSEAEFATADVGELRRALEQQCRLVES